MLPKQSVQMRDKCHGMSSNRAVSWPNYQFISAVFSWFSKTIPARAGPHWEADSIMCKFTICSLFCQAKTARQASDFAHAADAKYALLWTRNKCQGSLS